MGSSTRPVDVLPERCTSTGQNAAYELLLDQRLHRCWVHIASAEDLEAGSAALTATNTFPTPPRPTPLQWGPAPAWATARARVPVPEAATVAGHGLLHVPREVVVPSTRLASSGDSASVVTRRQLLLTPM
jgi:hypothetical protein